MPRDFPHWRVAIVWVAVIELSEWLDLGLWEGRASPAPRRNDDSQLKAMSLLSPSLHTCEQSDGFWCCRRFVHLCLRPNSCCPVQWPRRKLCKSSLKGWCINAACPVLLLWFSSRKIIQQLEGKPSLVVKKRDKEETPVQWPPPPVPCSGISCLWS